MAAFPKVEVKIKSLANNILDGCVEHSEIFPSIDTVELENAKAKSSCWGSTSCYGN